VSHPPRHALRPFPGTIAVVLATALVGWIPEATHATRIPVAGGGISASPVGDATIGVPGRSWGENHLRRGEGSDTPNGPGLWTPGSVHGLGIATADHGRAWGGSLPGHDDARAVFVTGPRLARAPPLPFGGSSQL